MLVESALLDEIEQVMQERGLAGVLQLMESRTFQQHELICTLYVVVVELARRELEREAGK